MGTFAGRWVIDWCGLLLPISMLVGASEEFMVAWQARSTCLLTTSVCRLHQREKNRTHRRVRTDRHA